MMLSPSPSTIARSSLEEMLDSLRRRDEIDKPKDAPPALPSRPTSKARTPPVGRALPVNFRVNVDGSSGCSINGFNGREDLMRKDNRLGNFAFKRLNRDQDEESPYMLASENENGDRMNGSNLRGSYWEDNIGYFLQKKLHVWCQLPNGQWELGTIQSSTGAEASVMLSNKKVIKISTVDLLPANPDIIEGVDDLVQLGFLNEPSVLHSLHRRFSQDKIYSNAGSVLIAFNPLKDIKQYGKEFIEAYRQRVINNPHVYATTDAAYSGMLRDEVNQSIIISGESGAGKTETAKAVLEYLTSLGGVSGIDDRISRANVILEAFGNAKTSRNNNASRFGKLIETLFSRTGKICGASRVVCLVNGERSFHVFYQLCAGLPSRLKDKFNIRAASEYSYLNHSECLVIGGVDDARKFNILVEALDTLQFTKEDQEHAFGLLAAVLWIGNITFQIIDSENHVEVIANEAVANAAKLMGCSFNELKLVLSTHKEQSGKDSIAKKSTLQQATDARDALAKFIYASLFDWLVEQINKSLQPGREYSGRSINKNGFEQFCINYANERLQQHFIRHLFKLQQEDYEFNGVDGMKVNFEDNQECLNLIEKHFKSHPRFKGERGRAFGVRHYAGEVVYDTNGFLEKNRDLLHSDSIQLFSSCASKLLKIFASKMVNHSYKPAGSMSSTKGVESPEPGVGTKYKALLFELFHKLERTSHHFICCMRPNRSQVCGLFEEDLVLQQLRYCGILEVIRISRSGYPIRITHKEFAGRYEFFLEEAGVARDPLSISIAVLQHFNVHPEMYHVGYTKLLFRTGQIRAALEERRTQAMQSILGRFSFTVCAFNVPSKVYEQQAIIRLQSVIRGSLVRNHFMGKSDSNRFENRPNRGRRLSEDHALPATLTDLQKRVLEAEATIGKKEEENAALRDQVKQFEARRIGAGNSPPHYYDSEDTTSMESRTPREAGAGREMNGTSFAVNNLVKEFEQQKNAFDDDAKGLAEAKSGQGQPGGANTNTDEEYRKIKVRFEAWKKEYKAKLRENKPKVHKHGPFEADIIRRKWWGKLRLRSS
ncbi:Myosin-2 [Cucurbita argyrosperma subsp. argyrosperma]|nr:Myosin-2 [Cucurbita argyrosperma subsp. argyrosperma]